MKKHVILLAAAALAATFAHAQETKVAIGISGWTGFAPLTLAK
jgi:NitT/TauT family transport system substrate-binding protein